MVVLGAKKNEKGESTVMEAAVPVEPIVKVIRCSRPVIKSYEWV